MSALEAGGDIVRSASINSAISASSTPSAAFSSADAMVETTPCVAEAPCGVREANKIEADE